MKGTRWVAGIAAACTLLMNITIPVAAATPIDFEAVPGFSVNHSTEPDILLPGIDSFQCPDLTYYNHIIFVGDSRTYQLSLHVDDPRISFISKSGMGLSWFKNTGYQKLQTLLKKNTFATPLRSAIIVNLGINDLYNQDQYIEYMNSIVPSLVNQNCDLYYMSLNPVDTDIAPGIRPIRDIKAFNTALRSELDDRFTYLNCYNYLEKTGFDTKDGLHYTPLTYSKIFHFVIDKLNAKKPVTSNVQWKKAGAYWYAVAPSSGKKYKNRWINYENAKFHLNQSGKMDKNRWITTNNKKYYVGASGRLCVSQWIKTAGKYYYVQANGVMAVNTVVDGYTIDSNGVRR